MQDAHASAQQFKPSTTQSTRPTPHATFLTASHPTPHASTGDCNHFANTACFMTNAPENMPRQQSCTWRLTSRMGNVLRCHDRGVPGLPRAASTPSPEAQRDFARDLPMPHNEAAMQYEDKSSTLLCFPGIVLKVMMLGAVATPQTSRDRASPGEVHKPRPV